MKEKMLNVLIADDEPLICNILTNGIDLEGNHLSIAGVANDGETLLRMIHDLRPDIVITDIYMPLLDGLEVVKRTREENIKCEFIIISGYRQFEYAYNALKYDVADFILKPIDEVALNASVKKIAEDIRLKNFPELRDNVNALRRYFFSSLLEGKSMSSSDIATVNQDYAVHFHEGFFRCLLINLDYDNSLELMPKEDTTLYEMAQKGVTQNLTHFCYEMLYNSNLNGMYVLINYSEQDDPKVVNAFKKIYTDIEDSLSLFGGVKIAVCSSLGKNMISQIPGALEEARTASWARRFRNHSGVILYHHRMENITPIAVQMLEKTSQEIIRSAEKLDFAQFTEGIDAFFALPENILTGSNARHTFLKLIDDIFEIHKTSIENFSNPHELQNEFLLSIQRATNITRYREMVKRQFKTLFEQIISSAEKQNKRPIRQAINYVEQNYSQKIDLNIIATQVGLSAVYFSALFKKELGVNFTDYVNDYRINIAKQLLRNTNMSVKEISYKVGFSDSQYFSKLFKKTVGIKPMDYRKFYG